MQCLLHQLILGMQKNDLTVSEAAWALAKLIKGTRPHLNPTSSYLLLPPSSQSSPDSPKLAMLCVATLLPNDAQEQNLKLQQTPHFGQCVLIFEVYSQLRSVPLVQAQCLGTVAYRGGWFGVFKPPPPEIPKISVESSIAWARRTGVSISFCSSLCSHTVVIY